MATDSAIQWTTHTWNPWHGCTKVSAGCKFCYMYRDKERYGQDPRTVLRSKTTFNAPLRKGKHHWPAGGRVFTCSWSDWFIEEADEWRDDAWAVIRQRPDLTFQVLTKRPERIAEHLPADWGDGYPNVQMGVSVEDQPAFDLRVPILRAVPAAVRFLSCEPLLGPIRGSLHDIGWCIIGGESGSAKTSRPCDAAWIRALLAQCQADGVAPFVKQLGSQFVDERNGIAGARGPYVDPGLVRVRRLRDGHGGDTSEWPPELVRRQFPDAP